MPRYTYRCNGCEEAFEETHSMSIKLENCVLCEATGSLVRVPSTTFITTSSKMRNGDKKVGDVVKDHIETSKSELKTEQEKLKGIEYKQ